MSAAAAVLGFSTSALNATMATVHGATFPGCPGPFQGSSPIGSLGVKSVSWSIPTAPVVDLSPSDDLVSAFREQICVELGNTPEAEAWAQSVADESVLFGVSADSAEVTVVLDDESQKSVHGTLRTVAQASLSTPALVVVQIQHSAFELDPPDPSLQWLIDHVVTPQVQANLNQLFATGLAFTPFPSKLLTFSPPQISNTGSALLAYASLGSSSEPPPASLTWPSGRGQELASMDAWDKVLADTIRKQHLGDHGETGFDIKVFSFKAEYHYGISTAKLTKRLSSSHAAAKVTVGGGGSVEIKTFGFTIAKPGLGITAYPDVEVGLNQEDGALKPRIDKVDDLNLKIELPLPPGIRYLAEKIIDAIIKPLGGDIGKLLKKIDLGSTAIPVLEVGWAQTTAALTGSQVELVQEPASGSPTFMGLSAVPVATSTRLKLIDGEEGHS